MQSCEVLNVTMKINKLEQPVIVLGRSLSSQWNVRRNTARDKSIEWVFPRIGRLRDPCGAESHLSCRDEA
jgi:hypothetical protein